MFNRRSHNVFDIDPDETLLDARNLPDYNVHQMEGRIEQPIPKRVLRIVGGLFIMVGIVFLGHISHLQIAEGESHRATADTNHLRTVPLFPERGVITDRTGMPLAWNTPREDAVFSGRSYVDAPGFGHLLGYVQYPARDSSGYFYRDTYEGHGGLEEAFNDLLNGTNGSRLIETNAQGEQNSSSVARKPEDGDNIMTTIDARVQQELFSNISNLAGEIGFQGGAGVIMDVRSGDLLALASAPEYRPSVLAGGTDSDRIQQYQADAHKPFLNRAIVGLYQPGSIVKPLVALGALEEGVITPEKKIVSTGELRIPHPYYPDRFSLFRDWKEHGPVDVREAIAVSSNEYFYQVGGGYQDQEGLGIRRLVKYFHAFGLGEPIRTDFENNVTGTIPSPDWKEEVFGEPWRLGDTYHTAIGQYGFQMTPLHAVRAAAAIANNGYVLRPEIIRSSYGEDAPSLATTTMSERVTGSVEERVPVSPEHFAVVREGMRQAVVDGTAGGLSLPGFSLAAKTGTAEVGSAKKLVNSWVIGFFPYERPRYAFAVVMERGPSDNTVGGLYVMRQTLEWMRENTPEYISRQ